jgi:hypothetical protein
LIDDPASKTELTNSNLEDALRVCLITAAEESFQREMKALRQGAPIPRDSDLRKVNPYIDPADGILKVNGRLEHAPLTESARHPVIISPDHRLAGLIINQAHVDAHHAGVEHTLATIRTKYYLLRGRRAVRKIIARCASCRFNNSMPSQPMMANLPKERLQPYVTPFSSCGLDLFGPLHTVIGRRTEKRWVMLANCFSTRAVHLELLYSLSRDSCLMGVRRLIADRGRPVNIYSDNGTNFLAADKELQEGVKNLNSRLVADEVINQGINWCLLLPVRILTVSPNAWWHLPKRRCALC